MLFIRIVAVGKIKEAYIRSAIEEYKKRLSPFIKLEIIELKDEGLDKEAQKIESYLNPQTFVLDEQGKHYTSVEFAQTLFSFDGIVTFIIGGADGIHPSVKKNTLSLSSFTFIHEHCRLLLLEQLYRACMIAKQRTYHR